MGERRNGDSNHEPAAGSYGLEALVEMQRPALATLVDLNSRLYESAAAFNGEWVSFVNRRLKEDLAVPQQLAACKTAQDVYRVYADYFQSTCSQYQAEFEQITRLGKLMAEDTAKVLRGRTEGGPHKS